MLTGAVAIGQGLKTALAQICAEQLDVQPSDIAVVAGDTGAISMGLGAFASRQTIMGRLRRAHRLRGGARENAEGGLRDARRSA